MPGNFEDKLMQLIAEEMSAGVARDEIMTAMELRLMAMTEEE